MIKPQNSMHFISIFMWQCITYHHLTNKSMTNSNSLSRCKWVICSRLTLESRNMVQIRVPHQNNTSHSHKHHRETMATLAVCCVGAGGVGSGWGWGVFQGRQQMTYNDKEAATLHWYCRREAEQSSFGTFTSQASPYVTKTTSSHNTATNGTVRLISLHSDQGLLFLVHTKHWMPSSCTGTESACKGVAIFFLLLFIS